MSLIFCIAIFRFHCIQTFYSIVLGCAPPPGTYNPTSDMNSKIFSNNTGLKKKDSKFGETMTHSPPLKCTRTFSLPVFRTVSDFLVKGIY